jgi:hypothetical protein
MDLALGLMDLNKSHNNGIAGAFTVSALLINRQTYSDATPIGLSVR